MNTLNRIQAIFIVAIKRIFSQFGLALAAILGLLIAVALTMSIPLYADGVYYRTFLQNIEPSEDTLSPRPPFAFMLYYGGGLSPAVQWEDTTALDQYVESTAAADLSLPQQLLVRHFRSEIFKMYPIDTSHYEDVNTTLAFIRFGFISSLEQNITLLEGSFPQVAEATPNSVIEVMIAEVLANELGLQVGEEYIIYVRDEDSQGIDSSTEFRIRISAVWRAADPTARFWFFKPSFMDNQLIVPEETFRDRISPYLKDEIYAAVWYLVMDGKDVDYSIAPALVQRINNFEQEAKTLLPKTRLAVSPRESLNRFRQAANLLTILLLAFSIPIIGLLLSFVGLTSNLAIERRRNEIAVLRSRGAQVMQMVGVALLEGLLLGLVALAIGLPLSALIANLIGRARSFLNFTSGADLRVTFTVTTLAFGAGAVALVLVAQALPTLGAARHTVITYKQERARMLRRPWWQRAWLDVLLLIPTVYSLYVLSQQGAVVEAENISGRNPFENPLLFLVPALMIVALSLLFLRIMPLFMNAASWLMSRTKSVTLLLASRHLARTPGFYSTPLLLLVLTLSLSAFTASLAETLDSHLTDQVYYQLGADVEFFDFGEDTTANQGGFGGAPAPAQPAEEQGLAGPRWRFLPLSDYLAIPGIEAVARVGSYPASATLSGRQQNGTFMGLDRYEFTQVAYWREDFADDHLGALMNALALEPNGLLLAREFMERHTLEVGDTLRLAPTVYGQRRELDMKIVGSYNLFPTWYPDDGPLFVGNLDFLFEQMGSQFPYNVWLRANTSVDPGLLENTGIRVINDQVVDWDSPVPGIRKEQGKPERQGLFGVLSVGFGAAAVLTVLGFLLYALFSFRRRFIEVGVLRAIGLSNWQMVAFLAWELAFLILMGGLIGTGLGALVSSLFIPYLQVGVGPAANIPPFVVKIAWPTITRIYVLFALLFVAALFALAVLLRRMKIFQAIKLGETV